MAAKIKKGDRVVVLSGKDKGKTGEVTRSIPKEQKVIVAGHANSLGSARHNEELATRRAEIVREHLIGHGISSDRIVVLVYGKNEAVKRPSPTDRRVVVFATTEAPATVARRELRNRKVISATYTRGDVLITETAKTGHTGATITEQVAGR